MSSSGSSGVDFEALRKIALALPGVEEGTSYGTPAFRVKNKFLARLIAEGESLAMRMPIDERDLLLQLRPEIYYITEHYRAYPAVLIRLSKISPGELRDRLHGAWERLAPRSLVDG